MPKIEKLSRTITAMLVLGEVNPQDLLEACVDIASPLEELFSPEPVSKDYPYLNKKTPVERCRYIFLEIENYARKKNDEQLCDSIERSINNLKSTKPQIYKTWMAALGKPVYMRLNRKER
jgi:hypothetical protein